MSKKKDLGVFKQKGTEIIKVDRIYYEILQRAKAKEVGYCVKCRSKRD